MINFFKLHNNTEDKGAYSWIVVNGPEVFFNFQQLVKKITEKSNCSMKSLSRRVSKRIGCTDSILYDIANGRTKWISLKLIESLLIILKEIGEEKEALELRKKFLNSIKFLKSTPRSVIKIKVIKRLSAELAEFCGIHAADGSLNFSVNIESKNKKKTIETRNILEKEFPGIRISKIRKNKDDYYFYVYLNQTLRDKFLECLRQNNIDFWTSYRVEFVDNNLNAMRHLKNLILELFGYNVKIKSIKGVNGYYIHFSNKIIGRYLKNIFKFPVGKKSDIVDVPRLIKEASFEIRKAFVRGLLQFDGSVKINGNVVFSTNSKRLLNFFRNTIKEKNLPGNVWKRKDRKKELVFESPPNKKWLTYFVKGTSKYQRLYEHIYGFRGKVKSTKQAIKILEKAFPSNKQAFSSFPTLVKRVKQLKEFTRYQILNILKSDYTPKDYKLLSTKLDILEKANIIKVNPVKMLERFQKQSDKITFNKNFRRWKLPLLRDKNIDDVVDVVHNARLSKKVAKLVPLAVIKGE